MCDSLLHVQVLCVLLLGQGKDESESYFCHGAINVSLVVAIHIHMVVMPYLAIIQQTSKTAL